jgi:phosphopantothenoylcysteine decarboxylase
MPNESMAYKEAERTPATAVAAALNDGKNHLLLAASGSVAVIKLPLIISSLASHPNLSIRVILTKSATHFLAGQSPEQPTVASLSFLPNVDSVHQDEDEWIEPWKRDAKILHIELRRWSHLLVVAPLTANTLAKVSGGFADNLLTNVIRAWDINPINPKRPRIIVALAMNSSMWAHPITSRQIRILEEEWGVNGVNPDEGWIEVLRPQIKTLACGDFGQGGMRNWQEIVAVIEERLCLTTLKSEDS